MGSKLKYFSPYEKTQLKRKLDVDTTFLACEVLTDQGIFSKYVDTDNCLTYVTKEGHEVVKFYK